ncbi:hypothetical protein LTR10_018160 [Elasticomyces elasticus]|uniref:Exocyst complex component EXO84 n=1 Tax=Exophiala sideris TaxID=1016849 RepID=A0ABR0J2N1_9EURO|nr:hypothetical protein LTR10_018160 [Elasticomyces elasticus]KAK5024960.1 hypothetical protein LTS07_008338 [Exophiala sideris]KAK5031451.1 hypothetical protein LTR13_007779 [Exophiala sideris]KAK5054998.1 hypothetical protein LTR69_008566 [Exophiala sideris]KAK5179879.1 hypothetical protein LTR44_007695 [Eurotiomycetes sp. CCFEE 6388]
MPIPVRSESPQKADNDAKAAVSDIRYGAGKSLQQFSAGKHRTRLPAPPSLGKNATSKDVKQPSVPTKAITGPGITRSRSLVAHTVARVAAQKRGGVASSSTLTAEVPSNSDAQITKPDPQQRSLGSSTSAPFERRAQNDRVSKLAAPRAGVHKKSPTSIAAPLVKKPAFNTYDKHYSPKKTNNRPAVSSTFAKPHATESLQHAPGSIEPSPVVNRLFVDELLQLSLLRDRAGQTLRNYEASISAQVVAADQVIKRDKAVLLDLERTRRSQVNAQLVVKWVGPTEDLSTVQGGNARLLVVARCVKELSAMIQEDGPLHKVMKEFAQWHVLVASKGKNREFVDDKREEVLTAAPLNSSWTPTVDSIEAKINDCRDLLADLQAFPDESSISALIAMHLKVAAQILQAIDTCRAVEGLILQREKDWMQSSLTNAIAEAEKHHFSAKNPRFDRTGVWNTFQLD